MKKLILISILAILSLKSVGQVNTDEYKNYKPCVECATEQWQKSRTTGEYHSNNSSSTSSNKTGIGHTVGVELKNGTRTIVVGCVSIVAALTGVIIYQKLNNEINTIH